PGCMRDVHAAPNRARVRRCGRSPPRRAYSWESSPEVGLSAPAATNEGADEAADQAADGGGRRDDDHLLGRADRRIGRVANARAAAATRAAARVVVTVGHARFSPEGRSAAYINTCRDYRRIRTQRRETDIGQRTGYAVS